MQAPPYGNCLQLPACQGIANSPPLMGDGFHTLAQGGVVLPRRLVSHGHAAEAGGFTRPPFAHPVMNHQMRDSQ